MSVEPEKRPRKAATRHVCTFVTRIIWRIDVTAIVLALIALPAVMQTFTF